jgi:hypothetical protein
MPGSTLRETEEHARRLRSQAARAFRLGYRRNRFYPTGRLIETSPAWERTRPACSWAHILPEHDLTRLSKEF